MEPAGRTDTHSLAVIRLRISSFKIIRCRLRLTAASNLGGMGGFHGIFVGTIAGFNILSITAARTA